MYDDAVFYLAQYYVDTGWPEYYDYYAQHMI